MQQAVKNQIINIILFFSLLMIFIGGCDIILFLTINLLSIGLVCVGSSICIITLLYADS